MVSVDQCRVEIYTQLTPVTLASLLALSGVYTLLAQQFSGAQLLTMVALAQ